MNQLLKKNDLIFRPAEKADAVKIADLLAVYGQKELLLPRTAENILKHISNFIVAEYRGCFIGTVALRDFGDSLYEIRSLAVKPGFEGGGTGSKLVESLLQGLKKADVHGRVFALTYRTAFFMRMGFKKVSKELFPQKIWSDCAACPKKDCCDEEAVMLEI